jgi:hypothetical protein
LSASHLNPNQRRRLEVVLAHLERAITEIERLAKMGREDPGQHLTLLEADLPESFEATAIPLLHALREEIDRTSAAFELTPRHMSRARTVAALVHTERMRVEDSKPSRLHGYGVVHPALETSLTPHLQRIESLLTQVGHAAAREHRE